MNCLKIWLHFYNSVLMVPCLVVALVTGCTPARVTSADPQTIMSACKPPGFVGSQLFIYYGPGAASPTRRSAASLHAYLSALRTAGTDAVVVRTWPGPLAGDRLELERLRRLKDLFQSEGISKSHVLLQRMGLSDQAIMFGEKPSSIYAERPISVVPIGLGQQKEISQLKQCANAFLANCMEPGKNLEAACKVAADRISGKGPSPGVE